MKTVILAAGIGSRLGELTRFTPKSLLCIDGDITIIEKSLDVLKRGGLKDIVIVNGFEKEKIEKVVGKKAVYVFNPLYNSTNVIFSLWLARDYLKEGFIFLHADTLFHPDILDSLLLGQGDVLLAIDFKPCEEEHMKVMVKNGLVLEINKTMPLRDADGEFIGLAKISREAAPKVIGTVDWLIKNKETGAFFELAIQKLIDDGSIRVSAVDTKGNFWMEVDFLEDLEKARSYYNEQSML